MWNQGLLGTRNMREMIIIMKFNYRSSTDPNGYYIPNVVFCASEPWKKTQVKYVSCGHCHLMKFQNIYYALRRCIWQCITSLTTMYRHVCWDHSRHAYFTQWYWLIHNGFGYFELASNHLCYSRHFLDTKRMYVCGIIH